ncbi:hypothetical protein Tco_1224765 [Tanacetum coccineum]
MGASSSPCTQDIEGAGGAGYVWSAEHISDSERYRDWYEAQMKKMGYSAGGILRLYGERCSLSAQISSELQYTWERHECSGTQIDEFVGAHQHQETDEYIAHT